MSDLRPTRATLANGLTVLTVTRVDSPIVAVLLMYRAGSLHEPPGKTGLAHLTEHMMFRGTPSMPQGDIDRLTGRLGGTNNAMTTCDHALYYFVLPSEHWRTPLSIEVDRMFHCGFGDAAFQTERRIAMEERMMLDDDPETLLYEAVDALAFDHHPYRYPVIGLMEDLEGLTLNDLRWFYAEHYRPEEAVLAVVGGATSEEVLAEIDLRFDTTPPSRRAARSAGGPRPAPGPGARRPSEGPILEPRRTVLTGLSPSSQVVLAYRTPEAVHEDTPALELLAALLSSGRSSLLHRKLVVDLGLATEVAASKIPQAEEGLLYLSASLHPGVSPEECEEAVLDTVAELVRSGVSDDGLRRARNLTRVDLMLGRETSLGVAGAMSFWESLGDWRLADRHERGLENVTAEDVQRAAEVYLEPSGRSCGWLVP